MNLFGKGNRDRLTGKHETASVDEFSYGVRSRSTSIRIGHDTYENKGGYFEDRRPGSNIDPYLVTTAIVGSTILTLVPESIIPSPSISDSDDDHTISPN